jgi:tRNA-Thr(GGU) m(6)t(6)A37 methyltransferase TsaA
MNLFYGQLAALWPLVSPVEQAADEAAEITRMLRLHAPHARTLLELGSGGGHVAHHLQREFECHLTDLSEPMLEVSRRLNPACAHAVGDMRTLDLGRSFDVVLAHDAIDYMASEADLRATFHTAWRHLGPGGVACFVPDDVTETYTPGTDVSGSEGRDGQAVRLFEWSEPATAGCSTVTVHYAFLVRDASGEVQCFHEAHTVGLFPRATWQRLLAEQGFEVEVMVERTHESRPGRLVFIARKPAAARIERPARAAAAGFHLVPIGTVRGGRAEPVDDGWASEVCTIELDVRFDAEAVLGLDAFSHLEVVFVFDRVDEASVELKARHPRERTDWPRVGIFAQRGRTRPNRLGVSRCRLLGIDGTRLRVQGLDAIDGTPVLDIKPWMREFDVQGDTHQAPWSVELMRDYY